MIDEELQHKRNRNAKILAIVKGLAKYIPDIFYILLVLLLIPFLSGMAPYIKGDMVLENPMTNSQLTAILGTLVVCGLLLYLGKSIKKIKR